MPRRKTPVKNKGLVLARSLGAVDLHFHGAYGIDLFSASRADLEEMSARLWRDGVAAFCPTTLSAEPLLLKSTVEKLGSWIRAKSHPGAIPIGIHLEGPFINGEACGAHPKSAIRALDFKELEDLWASSQGTIKILTFALEQVQDGRFKDLVSWCRSRKILLSLGHTRSQERELRAHFEAGRIQGVTHAWNAMPFHHRSPGPLGAALGIPKAYVELILDQVHVAPTVIRWTKQLHSLGRLCFVSDCVPAAETELGRWYPFGPLQVQATDAGCRLEGGELAGGGKVLSRSFAEWVWLESQGSKPLLKKAIKSNLKHITSDPLSALGIAEKRLQGRQVSWVLKDGRLQVFPVDSPTSSS